jgi:hypothetical protein
MLWRRKSPGLDLDKLGRGIEVRTDYLLVVSLRHIPTGTGLCCSLGGLLIFSTDEVVESI